jgi:squalene cyclase
VVLHQAGGLPVSDAVYQRGVKFLLQSQREDGSWYVKSRSRPFQTYYESGFPHGKDQFISIAASSWAATALALACPPKP